jgi:hypothetical protein
MRMMTYASYKRATSSIEIANKKWNSSSENLGLEGNMVVWVWMMPRRRIVALGRR